MNIRCTGKKGFSLVEVNLAVFVMAVGLLTLMVLFPKGLEESQMGMADTHEAMFADYILSTLEGKALAITNWSDWGVASLAIDGIIADGSNHEIQFAAGSGTSTNYMNYNLSNIVDVGSIQVRLSVKSGRYGNFDRMKRMYFTELFYCGM